jgi:hypothetical protein
MDDDLLNSTEHGTYDRAGNPITFGEWMQIWDKDRFQENRQVARDEDAQHLVSTVFLGLDHGLRWNDDPGYRPILFETMIFCRQGCGGCDLDEYQERYSTEAQALAGHKQALKMVELESKL